MHLEIFVYWSHLYCRYVIAFPKANFAVDPHQTVPRGAVRFGSTLFATEDVLQTDKRCELLILTVMCALHPILNVLEEKAME